MLKMTTYGKERTGTPLVIAHGLFGSGRNWRAIARQLARERPVITPDLRNHGESFWARPHGYPEMAEDLARLIEALGGRADLLGHSMGGKAAMALALRHPERVRRLLVADIAPVAYAHSQRDLIEAMRGLDPARISSRAEAEAALAERIEAPQLRAFVLQSLDLGRKRWRLNLDALAGDMERITGWPALPGRFDGASLFLSGAESDYVRPEHRAPIRAQFTKARFAKIPGAGHWLHAENPRAFIAATRAFLNDGQDPQSRT